METGFIGKASSNYAKKTVVIFGSPRGGTTLIAGLTKILGIDIGSDLPRNLEDPNFAKRSVVEIKNSIKARNQANSVWGWKFPNAINYLDDIRQELINPHYVCVFRDPIAIATKWAIANKRPPHTAAWEALSLMQKNMYFCASSGDPYCFISYERSVEDPLQTTVFLSTFLEIKEKIDETLVSQFAKRSSTAQGGYKNSDLIR